MEAVLVVFEDPLPLDERIGLVDWTDNDHDQGRRRVTSLSAFRQKGKGERCCKITGRCKRKGVCFSSRGRVLKRASGASE